MYACECLNSRMSVYRILSFSSCHRPSNFSVAFDGIVCLGACVYVFAFACVCMCDCVWFCVWVCVCVCVCDCVWFYVVLYVWMRVLKPLSAEMPRRALAVVGISQMRRQRRRFQLNWMRGRSTV